MSFPTGNPDDVPWQQPEADPARPEWSGPTGPAYPGPPTAVPAPPDWRPPTIAQPPPPRVLPPQDMDALDEEEGNARTVTYGVGLVAGAIALILICLLCGRAIF